MNMWIIKSAANKRMQSDKLLRYAPQFAADARRYVTKILN